MKGKTKTPMNLHFFFLIIILPTAPEVSKLFALFPLIRAQEEAEVLLQFEHIYRIQNKDKTKKSAHSAPFGEQK